MRTALSAFLVAALLLPQAVLAQGNAIIRGVGFDESVDAPSVIDRVWHAADAPAGRRLVRLIVEPETVTLPDGAPRDFRALDNRIEGYARLQNLDVLIDLPGPPLTSAPQDPWYAYIRAIAERYRGRVLGYVVGGRRAHARAPAQMFAYFLKRTAINIRIGDPDARVLLGGVTRGDSAWLGQLYNEEIAAYLDGVAFNDLDPRLSSLVRERDPSASSLILGLPVSDGDGSTPHQILRRSVDVFGTGVSAVTFSIDTPRAATVRHVTSALERLFAEELVPLEDASVDLTLWRGGRNVTDVTFHKLLFDLGKLGNYLFYVADGEGLVLTMVDASAARPELWDPATGERFAVAGFSFDRATSTVRMTLPPTTSPLVVDWTGGSDTSFATREDVVTRVLPSVGEIVSRHQQVQARQDAVLSSYMANVLMEQHFRTSAADPGFDVVTENRFFVQGKDTEWEELSFRLNGTRWGANRPPFPLLQAEKALSLPLDLQLTDDYVYRLDGIEAIEGRACFVLRFDPRAQAGSFYQGTVWIDTSSYDKVKIQSVQSGLSAPVVSNEEIHFFGEVGSIDGSPVRLMQRSISRQIVLVAGRSLLVEREMTFSRFMLNPSNFTVAREAARASDRVMFRDTPRGLRYLVKRDGQRVVQDEVTTSATAAMVGATYDPSYDFPLPLGGLNYLNFAFLGEENQLAVLFGGVLALVNVQRPGLFGTTLDGSVDLFAIAVKSNDRVYDESGEIPGTRLHALPFSTGVNLGWRLGSFHKIVGSYQLRFDSYSRDETTADTFTTPSSTFTNGFGLTWEWKQRGYSVSVGATAYRRARWTEWGEPGDYRSEDRDYLKYAASVSKDILAGFHKLHFNAAVYGGNDLDRFSSYQFGFFDEHRIHGVPSSGVRFDDLAMARASYAFNIFDQYRLELAIDQAFGRSRKTSERWEPISGLGVGFTTKAWKDTLVRGDIGKSFLPARYREPGSFVFQIQVLKPL